MENWEVTLAKILKERNNPTPTGIVIGKVISGLPDLVITIGDEILLDANDLIVSNRLYNAHTHSDDEFHTPIPITLTSGNLVILMSTPNQQKYAVLDKVGE